MLFADISGFTQLVESVDPHTVFQTVRPLLDELAVLVRLHDGRIQQVMGDGFMSVFGLESAPAPAPAPAPCDVAERAVQAGLALVAAGRPQLGVHVGIEYGEVLVTPAWETAEYTVWGRVVNLAKRLCDLAGPSQVQVGPTAYARVGSEMGSAVPVLAALKGIEGEVLSHRFGGSGQVSARTCRVSTPGVRLAGSRRRT